MPAAPLSRYGSDWRVTGPTGVYGSGRSRPHSATARNPGVMKGTAVHATMVAYTYTGASAGARAAADPAAVMDPGTSHEGQRKRSDTRDAYPTVSI